MTDVADYLEVANAYGPALSPDGERLAYLTDETGVLQLWTATSPTDRQQLTTGDRPVSFVSWSPTGETLLFGRCPERAEHQALYCHDLATGEQRRLTDRSDAVHRWGGWTPDGERFAFVANRREQSAFDVYVSTVDGPAECVHETDGWYDAAGWGPDGERLLLVGGSSRFDKELYVLDTATGRRSRVTPEPEAAQLTSLNWGPDGEAVYLVTDAGADTRSVARLDLTDRRLDPVIDGGDWNVDGVTVDAASGRLLYARNVDGYSEVVTGRLVDATTVVDRHEVDVPAGVAGDAALSPDGTRAAVTVTNRTTPPNVFVVDTTTGTATQWTDAGTLPETAFVEPERVSYESHDGLTVPGWLTVPTVGSPPYPAVVDLHGGPADQRRPSLLPTRQFFVAAGYVLFEPNVRGSTGYGREYAALDDGRDRVDAIEDVRCGATWLAERSVVDADRLGVFGASYGGYLALSTLTRHPELWAAGAEMSGIVDLVQYLETTAAWRRERRISEFGDPDADREFLRSISPVSTLENLTAPLLAIHGKDDPRVPVSELERLAAAAPDDATVETLLFEDEGHGFSQPETERRAYRRVAEFFATHLDS